MNRVAGVAVAGLLLALAVVALLIYSKQEAVPTEPPTPARPAIISADRAPVAATPPTSVRPPPATPEPTAAPAEGVDAATPDQAPPPPDELEPQDKGGVAPSGELTRRFDAIIEAMPPESQPSALNWNCGEGGLDCSVTGLIVSNEALADFAKRLEGPSPYGGTDRPPTVEINRVEQTDDGKAFELGVFIP